MNLFNEKTIFKLNINFKKLKNKILLYNKNEYKPNLRKSIFYQC